MAMAGFSSKGEQAIIASLPIAITNTIGTIAALKFVDSIGRRSTLLWTLPGIIVSLLGMGVCFALVAEYGAIPVLQIAIIGLITLYIAFFAVGMGPIPWTVNSEIYPLHLRSTGVSISTTANWVSNFLVSMVFLSITSS
mmetsp:Transcript_35675/g.6431  ORF Transcript_35675/g.6431 Transcript_35675/m.6431 type:complete len:139 (+) Transcript_35675:859-1275(+)